ncbi:hypothetical protein QEJ61_gp21 [Curtobacterium phage Pize]|uniref:hypothetical protein n=1 Tax=Curtobacterium phage Pize TaxID=2851068 RepID=UPI00220DDBD8|nr:hypothetical protein QEJ61_gp21 [Curtobacterium phage Pize]QXG07753.1 hypothetical protein [Curtobacterium phage Pize]
MVLRGNDMDAEAKRVIRAALDEVIENAEVRIADKPEGVWTEDAKRAADIRTLAQSMRIIVGNM